MVHHHDMLFCFYGLSVARDGEQKVAFSLVRNSMDTERIVEPSVLLSSSGGFRPHRYHYADHPGRIFIILFMASVENDCVAIIALFHLALNCHFIEWIYFREELND